jgi:hypothetical protein
LHEDPLAPQNVGEVGASQTPLLQHPVGHERESQTQWPFWHSRPAPHTLPVPQKQPPSGPQVSAVFPQAPQAEP